MKDTIPNSQINNRKLIMEVRYEPNAKIVDLRGQLLEKLTTLNFIPNATWELGDGMISLVDKPDDTMSKKCYIDFHRFSYISSANQTNESFFNSFNNAFTIVREVLGIKINRIGCRIQGTYSSNFKDFDEVLAKFLNLFPEKFLLADFPSKDLNFQLVYQNGQYIIGPVSEDDSWTKSQFPDEKSRKKGIGFAIDTDNYVIKDNNTDFIKHALAKDVYLTSLSVEKLLFEKLKCI